MFLYTFLSVRNLLSDVPKLSFFLPLFVDNVVLLFQKNFEIPFLVEQNTFLPLCTSN